jgi:large subunit ribosomal protein L34e
MPDNRFTFRTHHSFATRSNKNRLVRTPGGRLSVQHVQKKTGHHTCGDTGAKLNGIPALTSNKFKALSKNKKTVARAYGGVLSGGAVRSRIIRAFLVEERKVVKKVQKAQVCPRRRLLFCMRHCARVCLRRCDPCFFVVVLLRPFFLLRFGSSCRFHMGACFPTLI